MNHARVTIPDPVHGWRSQLADLSRQKSDLLLQVLDRSSIGCRATLYDLQLDANEKLLELQSLRPHERVVPLQGVAEGRKLQGGDSRHGPEAYHHPEELAVGRRWLLRAIGHGNFLAHEPGELLQPPLGYNQVVEGLHHLTGDAYGNEHAVGHHTVHVPLHPHEDTLNCVANRIAKQFINALLKGLLDGIRKGAHQHVHDREHPGGTPSSLDEGPSQRRAARRHVSCEYDNSPVPRSGTPIYADADADADAEADADADANADADADAGRRRRRRRRTEHPAAGRRTRPNQDTGERQVPCSRTPGRDQQLDPKEAGPQLIPTDITVKRILQYPCHAVRHRGTPSSWTRGQACAVQHDDMYQMWI